MRAFLMLLATSACAPASEEDSAVQDTAAPEAGELPAGDPTTVAIKYCRVTAQSLTIRNTPGGNVIGTVYNGEILKRDTSNDKPSWAYVYSSRLNIYGYAMSAYLAC